MSQSASPKYRAFISYSHADTSWAKWLQRGLEAFKIDKDLAGRETARGPIPQTLHPIFRDREDFTAGEALPEQTLAALDASHALIVVCSPDSATAAAVLGVMAQMPHGRPLAAAETPASEPTSSASASHGHLIDRPALRVSLAVARALM